MWIFWTLLILLLIVYVALSIIIYRKTNVMREDYLTWVIGKKYPHIAVGVVLFAFLLWLTAGQLWLTTKCWYDQSAYNVSTEYNWIKGQCLYTGKNGSKLPLWNTRDIPDGKDHSDPTLDVQP